MSSTINTSSISEILEEVVVTGTDYALSDDAEDVGNYNLENDYHVSLETDYDHTLKNHNPTLNF